MDPRTKELAHKLIHYSTHLEKGERIQGFCSNR